MKLTLVIGAIVWTAVVVAYFVNPSLLMEPPKKDAHTTNVIIIVSEK